jgi:hypothetical protein
MRIITLNSAFLCCFGKHLLLKQSFIIWIKSNDIILEVFWYISVLISSKLRALLDLNVLMYLFIFYFYDARFRCRQLLPASALYFFRNKPLIILSAISCQLLVIDPSFFYLECQFLTYPPLFNTQWILSMLCSIYFFHIFSLVFLSLLFICCFYFLFSRSQKPTMWCLAIHLCMFLRLFFHKLWLSSLWILSLLS